MEEKSMRTGSIWGRSVLVTGASKGIGKGMARVFARAGAKVLIVARDDRRAQAAADEITAVGGVATPFAAAVTNAEQMREAAHTAATRHGGLDVLCANAGIFPQAKLEDMKPELWDEVMSTNLKGTFLSVQACVPYLKNSDWAALC
jgi:3-oxoacyl-[acyl-carrier protein] reductase